jgi:hypothetical protein
VALRHLQPEGARNGREHLNAVRLFVVASLLRLAAWWARRFRATLTGRAFGAAADPRTSAAARFGFGGPWDVETVVAVPPEEAYPWRIGVAKWLVLAGLSVRGADRPFAAERVYRWLGRTPRIATLDPDVALGELHVAGPHHAILEAAAPGDPGPWVIDYRALLDGLPTAPGRHLAPCALWFDDRMRPVALDLPTGRFQPSDPAWPLARAFFQVADLLVHEAVSHLLYTHLHAEAVILATVDTLPPGHPVREGLAPTLAFVLQANANSGRVLLGEEGVFGRLTSAGWSGAAELMVRAEARWRFSLWVPPDDVAHRGVAGHPDYPARDVALRLWGVVHEEAGRGVRGVSIGPELVAWNDRLRAGFPAADWPALDGPAALQKLVAACLFATVRHSLVNAEQFDIYGCPPRWPTCLTVPPPRPGDRVDLAAALPSPAQQFDTIRATFAFSIQYNRLGVALPGTAAALAALRPDPRYALSDPDTISGSINA